MEGVLEAVEALAPVAWVRTSRWGYAALNATHILAIALLVGAMVPLNLVRLGLVRASHAHAAQLLTPFAAAGLALAILTGGALFAVRASEYAALTVVQAKLALVAVGALSAVSLHLAYGASIERASPTRRAAHAGASLLLWLAVLALGRLIAFAG
ncbi:DUF2214 domain-containing protein [Acuticoccus sp.]|uniref:DUF2214 domain-containing protein n=1 Tax=Acuticoccus sp. TaxID=1904378 RepID=UPI003B51CF27